MFKRHLSAANTGLMLLMGAILFSGCANVPSPTATVQPVVPTTESASNTPIRPEDESKSGKTPLPAGTVLRVRLYHSIDTRQIQPGDSFIASLSAPVTVENKLVVPKGTVVRGSIRRASASKRLKGRASVTLTLDRMEWNGAELPIDTNNVTWNSGDHKTRNLAWITSGSAAGALIGGLLGGGKGAAIGAGAGGGAGLAGATATGKLQVRIPAESVLTFRLEQPVVI
ncbi:MAG TPA: hypothetical protein VEX68_29455 [Bryobacteraceae bacterium]|nr:hypothetical protein [Bryobacteraceae bacterium]